MRWLRWTVWHKDAVPEHEGELAKDVKRWVLPTIDLILVLGSILALQGGVPAFALIYDPFVAQSAALVTLLSALGCFIGVSIPRLWALELGAKTVLAFTLLLYAFLLTILSIGEHPARGFVAGVAAALAVVPLWRIAWLGREHRRRKAAARLVAALTGGGRGT